MTPTLIKDLFACDISRRIEEVIKVDQADEQIIHEELSEYVVTNSIRSHFTEILDRYWETPNKPHEGIGVWVSGFFGSGKSSFAKYLGLGLENRSVLGDRSGQLLGQRTDDTKVQVLLKNISEHIPTEAVIFDVSTDRGIRTGNQTITEIMYRLFLQNLGYARDLDLSELEITLEDDGRLDAFKLKFCELFQKDWDAEKGKIAIAVQQASRVMHELDPDTYTTADSWRESAMRRADITPGSLARRCIELMGRRRPGKTLVFVIDEVGQFVARDVQKMLDLQAGVQNLGLVGRGKLWLVVTSQEKLSELVGGLDDRRVELARLMDRFPLQVHLEPSDISEVTSKRVLSKNAEAEKTLRELFNRCRGRLTDNTRITADIRLPDLTTDNFIDLYPLLPYQVDLIIQVVSGLRMQGGASKHVGGANRTIIKLAQQLLIHPDVNLASANIGALARIDQIYDLVASNIGSEIRGKIDEIGKKVPHALAQPVAKAVCLLQYVRSIHRTPENIAATLHPGVDADSRLSEVKAALQELEKAQMVRMGDDGYRIPTPAEDDWERQRGSLAPKPGDVSRIHQEVLAALWQPQPSYSFLNVKTFKAGLFFNGRLITEGDIPVHIHSEESGKPFATLVEDLRRRSQAETKTIFWAAALDDSIDRETVEIFRSREILARKERGAQTKDETALVSEERLRLRRHQDELRRLLKQALLTGTAFFRGNDRSPGDTAVDVGKTTSQLLAVALPEVFDRFAEAAGKVGKKDLDTLLTSENLFGLTPVFTDLFLIKDQGGKPVFGIESGPLAEVLGKIRTRTGYGEAASGRYLTDEFAKEPFGWDFDVVRLFVVSLLRAGKIEATSQGQVLESVQSLEARNALSNNNLFRQASFIPRVNETDIKDWADAAQAFEVAFGRAMPDISNASVVASSIRTELTAHEPAIEDTYTILRENGLPGTDVLRGALDQMRAIRSGKEDHAILTFNAAHRELKEAIKRSAELAKSLTPPRLHDLARARQALSAQWPVLENEPNIGDDIYEHAARLTDLLTKESFFREFPSIDQHARAIELEYRRRHDEAATARSEAYQVAVSRLRGTPGWEQLTEDERNRVEGSLSARANKDSCQNLSIQLLRSQLEACPAALHKAVEEVLRLVDGNRVVQVSAGEYFAGGIDTEEQLDAALTGLREQCVELIAAGKKVWVQ